MSDVTTPTLCPRCGLPWSEPNIHHDGRHCSKVMEKATLRERRPCKFCSRYVGGTVQDVCNECWEVVSRLRDFVSSPSGMDFVMKAIAEAYPDVVELVQALPAPEE